MPSPPRAMRPMPPPPAASGTSNHRTTMPRDFYHLGTSVRDDGDVFDARPATTPAVRVHPRTSVGDDETNSDQEQRQAKRFRRHAPILEDDSFVPVSKDLERMNVHDADFPVWIDTPQGAQRVRRYLFIEGVC